MSGRDELARVLAESNGTPWDYLEGGVSADDPYYRDADAIRASGYVHRDELLTDEAVERAAQALMGSKGFPYGQARAAILAALNTVGGERE